MPGCGGRADSMRYFAVSENREIKAKKIEAVLCDFFGTASLADRKILDLGCGSGHIAGFFARSNEVVAADVVDQRDAPETAALRFRKIDDGALPFGDGSFDIVIMNHVLFCMRDPLRQLREVRRVLRDDGAGYLASANRNFPVEGFTKLPLLHYLPARTFQRLYKRLGRPGDDLFPVGYHGTINLIAEAGFFCRSYTGEIIRHPGRYHSEYTVPFGLLVPECLSPTMVFILTKKRRAA